LRRIILPQAMRAILPRPETLLISSAFPAVFVNIPKRILEGSQLSDLWSMLREKNIPSSYPRVQKKLS